PAEGDGARADPRGSEVLRPPSGQLRWRDAHHLRPVDHHRPGDAGHLHLAALDPELLALVRVRHRAVLHLLRDPGHLLHVLLYRHHLQPGGSGGEPEEAGRFRAGREAWRAYGGVHRPGADPNLAARFDLPRVDRHLPLHAARGGGRTLPRWRARWYRAADRRRRGPRYRPADAAAPPAPPLRRLHEARPGEVPRPAAVHVTQGTGNREQPATAPDSRTSRQ